MAIFGLLALIIVLIVVVPRLFASAVGATIDTAAGKIGGARASRRRVHATFATSLDASVALSAATDAARLFDGVMALPAEPGGIAWGFETGGSVAVTTSVNNRGLTLLHMAPAAGTSDENLTRMRGAILASLRKKDPTARPA